ncbi:hypothetical protein WA026_012078 [Henosepilachna vigintioctopunctata]|uniref:Uncharacterized protein n=1 Tax=Henosepilachna vigintioctopunctata TaxID=420089 RepID=A0AAW1VAU4_9CUCU
MKYLGVIIFSFAVCQVMGFVSEPYDLLSATFHTPAMRAITKMLRSKCQNKTVELEEKIKGLKDCYLEIKETETICSVMKDRLTRCLNPLADFMHKCVESTKYADVPQFTLEIFNSVTNYVCQTKGEKLIELLHPCLVTLGYEKHRMCMKSFEQKLSNIEKDDTIKNVKTDICKSLEKTKTCFLREFKSVCHNDVTLNSAVGFYDAVITKPCKHI